ncbi:Lipoyl ligase [Aphanomyces cochlioides]|nr:Lipoyl ligase [Aphanomyces cochlioides]
MRHVAAFLLVVLGGNATPSFADVEKVITAVGGEVDTERLEALLKEVEGKDVYELIAAGQAKLATVSVGGGAASSGAAAAASAGGAAAAPAKEEPKEEEADLDLGGGMDMFGGSSDY